MSLRDLRLRLRALIAPRRVERELEEELAFHLERETEKHLADGLDPIEARRRAQVRFGSVALAADACRDERGTGFVDTTWRDVQYALRTLRRTPLTAVAIVATVALGLGLTAAAFTLYDAYYLRSDAVRDSHELFTIKRTTRPGRGGAWYPFTRREHERLRTGTNVLADAVGMDMASTTRIDGVLMSGDLVTGNFFQVLGVSPVLGRGLMPADDVGQGRRVLVLSHRGWRRLFAADPTVVDRTVRVNGVPYQIAGVMPEGFRGLRTISTDFWAPLSIAPELGVALAARDEPTVTIVVGRVKAGVTASEATTAITAWARTAGLREYDESGGFRYITLEPGSDALGPNLGGPVAGLFLATFLAFGLVLAIGCANVANLLLARWLDRQREIGVRMALGAARGRIIRQLLTESLILAAAAAAGGLAVSRLALTGALSVANAGAPGGMLQRLLSDPPPMDWRVVLFLAAGAVVATASFGLLPALQGTRFAVMLRTLRGEVAGTSGRWRARHALIAGQVGASALLFICAAVLLRSAWVASEVDYGVRTTDTLLVPITNEDVQSLVLAEVRALASVADVAASAPRFGRQSSLITIEVLHETGGRGTREAGSYRLVTPGYFDVLGMRVLEGRTFAESERTADAGVVVLAEWLMTRLFREGGAVGRDVRITLDDPGIGERAEGARVADRTYTVIGVVDNPPREFRPYGGFAGLYVPMGEGSPATELAVRVHEEPERARLSLLDRLVRIDPALGDVVTLQSMFGDQEHLLRTGFRATVVLGALALVLTVSGLFGVLSYLVAQRRSEIGVRMALGATARNVTSLVLSQSLRAVAIGLVAGAVLAGGLAKALMALADPAYGSFTTLLRPYDPASYGAGLLIIVVACGAAASLPALRAARIDPVTTLKQE